ncbi:GHKL domain-containing protein [Methylophaga sp. SB9B]|uniref:sensor histidine kinase n=1 Tax=Methylophaga sp. SB9B TaxID=2570356 RepID=UPI0010A7A50D|nr:ATP-binding protein [Methylophaga sp. SB9B]THK40970.1 GHKL domain-containing protein [Methylophaga sp. SB9B]
MNLKWPESSSSSESPLTLKPIRRPVAALADSRPVWTPPVSQPKTSASESRIADRLSSLLAVIPGGVVVIDGSGLVQDCNQVAINLLGEPLTGQRWIDVIKRAFKPREDDGHDVSLADGRLVHISTSPLDKEPGQIILLQEVTETRQLQRKVAHLQRLSAMGEMAARLAHQIRTPLSSATLYLAPLLKPETEQATQLKFARRLHDSLSHMEQLVRNMLAFSRGDMNSTAPVSVSGLIDELVQQFIAQPESESLNVQVINQVNDGYVYGCQPALVSALNNLLNNARQACGEAGKITIHADYAEEDQQQFIEISIEDNGDGIAEADYEKILQPFYTTRSAGTGLGLAVVQSVARAHKGLLWLDSEQGVGSTFCLRLPVYRPMNMSQESMQSGVMS